MGVQLIPAALLAKKAIKEGIKLPKALSQKSQELFGYDFVGLIIKILVIYVFSWMAEIYLKGRIFFEDPDNQRRIGLGILGVGGIVINLLFEYFTKQKNEGNDLKSISNEKIRQLFGEGIPVGQFNVKYWDLINILVNLLVITEALKYFDMCKKTNQEPSPMTYGAFAVLEGALAIATLPEIISKIRQFNFSAESWR